MNNEIALKLVQLYAENKTQIDSATQLRPNHGRVSKHAIWESIARTINDQFGKEYTIRQMKKKLQNMYASIKRKIGEDGAMEMTPAKRARLTDGESQLLDLVGPDDFRLGGTMYQDDIGDDQLHSNGAVEQLSTTTNLILEQLLHQHNRGNSNVANLANISSPSSISSSRKRSLDDEDGYAEEDNNTLIPRLENGSQLLNCLNNLPESSQMSSFSQQNQVEPLAMPEEQNRRHGRRKTHPVWNFFRTDPPNSAICILCNTRIAHGVSTSLCRHVASKHKEYESQIRNGTYKGGYREASVETPDNTITDSDQSGPDFNLIIANILMRRHDVNLLDDPSFQELLSLIPNCTPPTTKSLHHSVAVHHSKLQGTITERIFEALSIVLCASVIGVNRTEVIITLSAHMTNLKDSSVDRFVVDAEWCNREKLTTEEIAVLFNSFDEEYSGMASKISHYFVNNESYLVADLVKDLRMRQKPANCNVMRQPVDLSTEDAMYECSASHFWTFFDFLYDYAPAAEVLHKIDVLWTSLRANSAADKVWPTIILPANDSWPSKLAFYEWLQIRLINDQFHLHASEILPPDVLPSLSPTEISRFSCIIDYLKSVRAFFEQMAPESPTISFIIPSILALKQKITKSQGLTEDESLRQMLAVRFDHHFKPFLTALTDDCPDRHRIYLIASFLDRRTSFYLTQDCRERAASWLNEDMEPSQMPKESEESHDDPDNPFSVLENDVYVKPEMSGMCGELRTYLEEYAKTKVRMNFSTIGFWKEHSKDLPRLASKALQILAIPTGIEFAELEQQLACMSSDADFIPIKTAAMHQLNQLRI